MEEPLQFQHLENFLIPLDDNTPCGLDFEDSSDDEYIRIEREIGNIKEAREWIALKKDISVLLEKTKDFRLLGFYASACVNTDKQSFRGLVDCLYLAKNYITDYWECVYPLEEIEDLEDRFTDRLNAIGELSAWGTIVLPLSKRRTLLSFKGMQDYLLEDLLQFNRGEEVEGKQSPQQYIKALSKDEIDHIDEVLNSAKLAFEFSTEIKSLVSDKIGESYIEFDKYLIPMLQDAILVLSNLNPKHVNISENGDEVIQGFKLESVVENNDGSLSIKTRDDVVMAIDLICDYYIRQEPSSPLPLLLKRARSIVYKDFLEVLEELVPDSVSMTEPVFGRIENENENN